jgi:hypothetical protein
VWIAVEFARLKKKLEDQRKAEQKALGGHWFELLASTNVDMIPDDRYARAFEDLMNAHKSLVDGENIGVTIHFINCATFMSAV